MEIVTYTSIPSKCISLRTLSLKVNSWLAVLRLRIDFELDLISRKVSSNHGLSRFKSALRLRIEWLATLVLAWLVGDVGPNRMSVFPMISFFHNGLIKV